MTLPPLQFQTSSAARGDSGALNASTGFDSSGFSVNFGNGVSQGNSTGPVSPLLIGAALIGLMLWKKKSS